MKMDSWSRKKKAGRYIYKCPGCGVYIKMPGHCWGCVLEMLGEIRKERGEVENGK